MLEKFFSAGTLLWVSLQALDEEITLIVIENSFILQTIDDTLRVKWSNLAFSITNPVFTVHW